MDKGYLTNTITNDVYSSVVNIINYLTYGLRDHFVNLVKCLFPNNDKENSEITPPKWTHAGNEDENKEDVRYFLLNNFIPINNPYSLVFQFLHDIY